MYSKINAIVERIAGPARDALLLLIRLWWGWSFFLTGKGKLLNLDRTADYFGSLGIPLPKVNVILAGSTEMIGGLLLLAGLLSRIASLPLMFTLTVAYVTAERDALFSIFTDTDKFTGATPFLFLMAVSIVFAFGPGRLSLDGLLAARGSMAKPAPASEDADGISSADRRV